MPDFANGAYQMRLGGRTASKFCFAFFQSSDKSPVVMRRIIPFFLIFLLPLTARADGIVVPTVAYPAQVTIPDQQAALSFSNGVERLVIETRFTGAGTNFAWVIPFPNQPFIEEATPGFFPTVRFLCGRKIIHEVPHNYACILALVGIGSLLLFVRPTGRIKWTDILACLYYNDGSAVRRSSQNLPLRWPTRTWVRMFGLVFRQRILSIKTISTADKAP